MRGYCKIEKDILSWFHLFIHPKTLVTMEVQGTLHAVLPAVTGTGKNGNWKKQEFILDLPGTYPKKLCISTWGDKIDLSQFHPGDPLKVSVDMDSREFNGRWFTAVRAWKMERIAGDGQPVEMVPSHDEAPPVMAMDGVSEDDLPF
jgi:hypothetical protein